MIYFPGIIAIIMGIWLSFFTQKAIKFHLFINMKRGEPTRFHFIFARIFGVISIILGTILLFISR